MPDPSMGIVLNKEGSSSVFCSRLKKDRYLLIMLILPLTYYLIFRYGPMYGLLLSVKDFDINKGIMGSPWAGFKYFQAFVFDPVFWRGFRNTILLNVYMLIFAFPAPIILALLLNELKFPRFKRFAQSVSYMPYFISTVVVCGMIVNFFAREGMINTVLFSIGIQKINFLMEAQWFPFVYVTSEIWQSVGWGSIIYLAAITGVDATVYEAAIIDGAGRWKQLLNVTLPYLAPTISIMLILAVGNVMSVSFEKIILLYRGATYETSDVIATYVYRRGLLGADFSYATAVGFFQSFVGMIFILTANTITKKISDTSMF